MASTAARPKRVIVIGAGWAGLIAAKTYLQVDPTIDLTIIDAEKSLGGVWCAERMYPGFVADGPVGMFDYSDLPMTDVLPLKTWGELPGDQVHEYLKKFAEKFALVQRLKLNTKVSKVERNQDGIRWDVRIGKSEILTCDKLILATGLNSKPNWPDISTSEFSGLVIHSKDVGLYYKDLVSPKVNRVTVYGGSKSAIDTVNMCILKGKRVDWIIRETGNGPSMMIETKVLGSHAARLVGRWKNIFTPSIFSTTGFWYRFLHSETSKLGTWICSRIWAKASSAPLSSGPYKVRSPNIEMLMPETKDALFFTTSLGALHGDRNGEFVKQLHSGELIQVHRASINSMSGSEISLSNGSQIKADAVVFATGWEYQSEIFDPALALELGISASSESEDFTIAKYWDDLHVKADAEVLEVLPRLGRPPPYHQRAVDYTPTRLYRQILPSSLAAKNDNSLVVLGLVTSILTSIYAEVSALWGVAWMEGLLQQVHPTPSKAEMDYEIAKIIAWSTRRYPSRGKTRQIASAEIQQVVDLLMTDMGLEIWRKGGWVKDALVPYNSQDYKGIVEDFLNKSGNDNRVTAQ